MDNQTPATYSPETRLLIVLVGVPALLLIASFIFGLKIQGRDFSTPPSAASRVFPDVFLEAKAAYVYDIRNQAVLFAKNEDTRLSLASLTKLMTALVAEELGPLNGTIVINEEALKTEGDSGLYRDEKWLLKDILDFSLLTSSNDGMRAVALALGAISKSNVNTNEILNDFVMEMNKKAGELDLKNTYFWNETGLDESEVKGGAYGTAKDIAVLVEHILLTYPGLLEATKEATSTFRSLDNIVHIGENTNGITSRIPRLIVSKTGSTDTAGGNLVIVFDPEIGHPIVVLVLGSSVEGRFRDTETLINGVFDYLDAD